MSYAKNIENYRRQLHANVNYQNSRWFVWGTPAKMAFRDKLLRFAKRAGFDHLNAFDQNAGSVYLLPGGLGERRRILMDIEGRQNRLMKPEKIFRKSYMLDDELISLSNRMRLLWAMPDEPIGDLEVPDFQEVIFIRNHKRGEMHILDHKGTVKVIPWVSMPEATEEQLNEAWANIMIEPVSLFGEPTRKLKPLFRARRFTKRTFASLRPEVEQDPVVDNE